MNVWTIYLSSKSTRQDITPEWLAKVAAAVTIQLRTDFAPDYGLAFWTMTTVPTPGAFNMVVSDIPDQPGVLGYHDDAGDVPEAKVFTLGPAEPLDDLSRTISHEALELVRDQDAAGFRLTMSGVAFADEACDAVEDTSYEIDGVRVSNFVLPSWYVEGSSGPWDHLHVLPGPCTKTAGGYVIELRNGQVATDPPEAAQKNARKAHPESRTSRRLRACAR